MKRDKGKRCTLGCCDVVDKNKHAQSPVPVLKVFFFSSALSHVTHILSTANSHHCVSFVEDCALPSNTLGLLGKAWSRAGITSLVHFRFPNLVVLSLT